MSTRANLEIGVLCELSREGLQQLSSIGESYFDRESNVCADVPLLRTIAADTANRREARDEPRGGSLSLPRLPHKNWNRAVNRQPCFRPRELVEQRAIRVAYH